MKMIARFSAARSLRAWALSLTLAAAAMGYGCGGSGGSPPPPPPPTGLSYASPQTAIVGIALASLQPTVMGSVTSYSVAPALPAGLTLNGSTGLITGTPSAASAAADYTITASNAGGSASCKLNLAVGAVNQLSTAINRTVLAGTPVYVDVVIQPQYVSFQGTLYVTIADTKNLFASAVTVAANGNTYTLGLATAPDAVAGSYSDQLVLNLCSDAACTVPQVVPSVTVPFHVNVMAASSAWPGDHLSPISAWAGVADWTMFQGNAAHTGYVPVDLDPNLFTTRWQQGISQLLVFNGRFNLATVTTSGGRFYLAGGNRLVARNESDGSLVWQHDFSSLAYPSSNPPSVAGGVVYIASGQQSSAGLFAFDSATGAPVFNAPMSAQWENYLAPTIGPHGIYTNAGTYGGLFGIGTGGGQLFFDNLAQQSVWTPAVDATTVYAYTGDSLTLIDPVTGAVRGTIADTSFTNYIYVIGGATVLGAPGSAFAAAYGNSFLNAGTIGNSLVHFNTQSLSVDWSIHGDYPTTPGYAAGILYVANNIPFQLEARSEADGALLWAWSPPVNGGGEFKSEVLLTNNLALVSTDAATYAIDLATHHQVWSYPASANLALSQSGILYLEGINTLTAINAK